MIITTTLIMWSNDFLVNVFHDFRYQNILSQVKTTSADAHPMGQFCILSYLLYTLINIRVVVPCSMYKNTGIYYGHFQC